jgi:hypothetical protein
MYKYNSEVSYSMNIAMVYICIEHMRKCLFIYLFTCFLYCIAIGDKFSHMYKAGILT